MPQTCTRCQGTGFLNIEQVDNDILKTFDETGDHNIIMNWILFCRKPNDVQVCDCCGNGKEWYGVPGEHYNPEDPIGSNGPYAYNGGLSECN